MPSLFSRTRTTSTTGKKHPSGNQDLPYDEFGRVNSRNSAKDVTSSKRTPPSTLMKQKQRNRTLSTPETEPFAHIPDGSFLPLNLEPKDIDHEQQAHDYGYLSYQRHVVLGLDEVVRLVDVVASELGTRALTTPFIFSTLALDVSASSVRGLIRAFLETCTGGIDAEHRWREEARLAGPHELGMCIRWGLARVVRVVGGQAVRGLIAWDHYTEFRDSEAIQNYPPKHFSAFLPPLPSTLRSILLTLLSLLIRFTAHSTSSGHTPPTISPLFGPLLFGLGPATLAFHHTYIHYLRAVNATEHLLLSFIRWQSTSDLGVPTRLKEWIRSYPSTLPALHHSAKHERPQARRGARTVRVVSVRRNVRMYSPDLVNTAASWAHRPHGHGLAGSKEWERIAPPSLKLSPRYSEAYKKRMDLPSHVHPYTGPSIAPASATSSTSSSLSDDRDAVTGLGLREGEERFRSLTDLKWGEFEMMGFGAIATDEKKLQFDLTESARTARAAKRATLTWTDFSTTGFTRTDAPLSATLQFSTPLTHTISAWPSHNADLTKKLKKTARTLPDFGWDTEPVLGTEEVVEEAFVDVFCDLVWGGGWREEIGGILSAEGPAAEVERECNWALIEFKSLPISASTSSPFPTPSSGTDPRTSTTLVLFEEFVPLEYRQQLAKDSGGKRRMPFLFMSPNSKSRPWKPAATLNGRPYVVGHVPKSPSYREVEFEGLLRSNGSKVLSLDKPSGGPMLSGTTGALSPITSDEQPSTTHSALPTRPTVAISAPLYTRLKDNDKPPALPAKDKDRDSKIERRASDSPISPTSARKLASRFRVHPSFRRSGVVPAEYAEATVDFETRLASYSDDELNNMTSSSAGGRERDERRRSKDDAWVDILVATHSRRIGGQDADIRPFSARGKGMQDPEIASHEVAQVLAGVALAQLPSSDDEPEPIPTVAPSITSEDVDVDVDSVMSYPKTTTCSVPKRLGYFDLHPERRPGHSPQPISLGDDSDGDDVRYGSPDRPSPLEFPMPSNTDSAYPQPLRGSMDTEESDYAPTSTHSLQLDASDLMYEDHRVAKDKDSKYSGTGIMTMPQLIAVTPVTPEKGEKDRDKSRTAALIEMYREREKKSFTTSPVPVPKLPVHSTLLSPQTKESPLPPVPVVELEPVVVTPAEDVIEEPTHTEGSQGEELLQPLGLLYNGNGRDSPARYVHGAPLHNVMEEEEEE
ncbi:uncharacterized protein F5147DRAFT_49751 [Suillus discolor]|uniref:Meiotically up-regulated protein Msb1/Mug8 domain-containing protein n=1 Tax=Suillus discolor TaxID=1912936 RepID=A0A9P7FEP5_9AGAM|nr:uncharacterized protein F5147DRAFT_49751 [Suillus discolor]KAG2113542.1 hypothetical protein F5147DRAFT_49751 [Suillus discolor]